MTFKTEILFRKTEKELLFNPKPVLCPNLCLIQHTLADQTLNIPLNETHTDGQTKANPSGKHTQAHVPPHTNRSLSLVEVRGVKGLFVVLAPASCSQSISPFRLSLRLRAATLAMIEWLTQWVQDHDSLCSSQMALWKRKGKHGLVCMCEVSPLAISLALFTTDLKLPMSFSQPAACVSHRCALLRNCSAYKHTHQNAVRLRDQTRCKVIKRQAIKAVSCI